MAPFLVRTSDELRHALRAGAPWITVVGEIGELPTLTLSPGQRLHGTPNGCLRFAAEQDGVRLTSDNEITGLTLLAAADRRAIFNDGALETLGTIRLQQLVTEGQVQLLAKDALLSGSIVISDLFIRHSDTRNRPEMISGNGVQVMQGALTIWNQQRLAESRLHASLQNIRIGGPGAAVLGGGVFLSGSASGKRGRLQLDEVDVHSIHVDSGLPEGTTTRVAAGLFVLVNARASRVRSTHEIETHGANCVALDNWGHVDEWIAEGDVRSYGPSAIGVVNAGSLHSLRLERALETFGEGARGISIYADTGALRFRSVITHGNAASGFHITRHVERLEVTDGIVTHGGPGRSLVKGVLRDMHANGIDVVDEGSIGVLAVNGWSAGA